QALGKHDSGMDRFPGDWIDDVGHLDLERVPAHDPWQLGVVKDFVADESRAVQLAVGVAEDRPGTAGLPVQQRLESLALRLVCALVDEGDGHAISFMYGRRPVRVLADGQTI